MSSIECIYTQIFGNVSMELCLALNVYIHKYLVSVYGIMSSIECKYLVMSMELCLALNVYIHKYLVVSMELCLALNVNIW